MPTAMWQEFWIYLAKLMVNTMTSAVSMTHRPPLQIMRSVIFALFIRELRTRFGMYRLGYAWALLEPALHIVILSIVFGFGVRSALPGIDFPIFLITGIVPWLLFSNIVSRSLTAVTANTGLFNYRQVRPFDAVMTRILLEAIIHSLTFATLMLIAAWLGYQVALENPLGLFALIALLLMFTTGAGLIVAVAGTLHEEVAKFIPFLLRPLYFISGIFFPLEIVPREYHDYLLWNPLLHAMELMRDVWFAEYQTTGGSWFYLAAVSLGTMTLGMLLYRRHWVRMVST